MSTGKKNPLTKQSAFYVDVTRLLRRHVGSIHHTGIDRVNLEYARWIHGLGGGLCLHRGFELKTLSRNAWGKILLGELQPGSAERLYRHRILFLLRSLVFRKPISEGASVTVSTHSWLGCWNTWQWLAKRRCKSIVFIHDLIPVQFPEYSNPREKKRHIQRLENTLTHSQGIIVNSRCTESALRRHAHSEGLPVPPVLVAPLGHDTPVTEPAVEIPLQGVPDFVVLGTIEPRKNHLLLLTLWRELVRRHGSASPRLVVIGRRGWECEQVVDILERCEAIHPFLIERNDASDAEVSAWITGAKALLMPSFAEGFGMPVQEALALGTPVISSPLPAIREFAEAIPDYAETYDGTRWLELIEAYASPDSPLRSAQIHRLQAFKETTWPGHFCLVEEFLRSLDS